MPFKIKNLDASKYGGKSLIFNTYECTDIFDSLLLKTLIDVNDHTVIFNIDESSDGSIRPEVRELFEKLKRANVRLFKHEYISKNSQYVSPYKLQPEEFNYDSEKYTKEFSVSVDPKSLLTFIMILVGYQPNREFFSKLCEIIPNINVDEIVQNGIDEIIGKKCDASSPESFTKFKQYLNFYVAEDILAIIERLATIKDEPGTLLTLEKRYEHEDRYRPSFNLSAEQFEELVDLIKPFDVRKLARPIIARQYIRLIKDELAKPEPKRAKVENLALMLGRSLLPPYIRKGITIPASIKNDQIIATIVPRTGMTGGDLSDFFCDFAVGGLIVRMAFDLRDSLSRNAELEAKVSALEANNSKKDEEIAELRARLDKQEKSPKDKPKANPSRLFHTRFAIKKTGSHRPLLARTLRK